MAWASFALFASASTVMTLGVICYAFYVNQQFYPSVVYLSKSNACVLVLYNMAFVVIFFIGTLLRKLFFGQLRFIEVEHLYERARFAITETCLAMTMFRDDLSAKHLGLFSLLIFSQVFHWLSIDRVNFMEQSPVITRLFHARVSVLLTLLFVVDTLLSRYFIYSVITWGPSIHLLLAFEYVLLMLTCLSIIVKYMLHTIDLRRENPWELKSLAIFYLELVIDGLRLIVYIIFFYMLSKFYGLPLHIVRDLYLTFRSFTKRLFDMVQYRRATANMNERYPNATPEELALVDNTCIICREEMTTAKRLACGHVFHLNCLRSWLERQQTCPTCRSPVMPSVPAAPAVQQQQEAAAVADVAMPQNAPAAPVNDVGGPFVQHAFRAPGGGFLIGGVPAADGNLGIGGVPANNVPVDGGIAPPRSADGSAAAGDGSGAPAGDIPAAAGASGAGFGAPAGGIPGFTVPMGGMNTAATGMAAETHFFNSIPPAYPAINMGMPPLLLTPILPVPPHAENTLLSEMLMPFTDDELILLEGEERHNLEARIRMLHTLSTHISGILVQWSQYEQLVPRSRIDGLIAAHAQARAAGANTTTSTSAASTVAAVAQSSPVPLVGGGGSSPAGMEDNDQGLNRIPEMRGNVRQRRIVHLENENGIGNTNADDTEQ